MSVTIQDIAGEAGISGTTVSRAHIEAIEESSIVALMSELKVKLIERNSTDRDA